MKSRVIVSTSVPSEVGDRLENEAHKQHLSVSSYTRQVLLDHLAEKSAAKRVEVKRLSDETEA